MPTSISILKSYDVLLHASGKFTSTRRTLPLCPLALASSTHTLHGPPLNLGCGIASLSPHKYSVVSNSSGLLTFPHPMHWNRHSKHANSLCFCPTLSPDRASALCMYTAKSSGGWRIRDVPIPGCAALMMLVVFPPILTGCCRRLRIAGSGDCLASWSGHMAFGRLCRSLALLLGIVVRAWKGVPARLLLLLLLLSAVAAMERMVVFIESEDSYSPPARSLASNLKYDIAIRLGDSVFDGGGYVHVSRLESRWRPLKPTTTPDGLIFAVLRVSEVELRCIGARQWNCETGL